MCSSAGPGSSLSCNYAAYLTLGRPLLSLCGSVTLLSLQLSRDDSFPWTHLCCLFSTPHRDGGLSCGGLMASLYSYLSPAGRILSCPPPQDSCALMYMPWLQPGPGSMMEYRFCDDVYNTLERSPAGLEEASCHERAPWQDLRVSPRSLEEPQPKEPQS